MAPRRSSRISISSSASRPTSPNRPRASPSTLQSTAQPPYAGPLPVITNVVCGADLGCMIDLKILSLHMRNAEYRPSRFPACIVRKREPRATALIFAKGKIQIVGAGSIDDARLAARKFERAVRKAGFGTGARLSGFRVQNLVARVDCKFPIRLEGLVHKYHALEAHYEPELFPGMVFRMREPKVCFVVFAGGKVNLLGATTQQDLDTAMRKMWPLLVEFRKW